MSSFNVMVEVFEPHTKETTIRIGIPVEALRALVENGIGQFHVVDDKLQDCCGVRAVFVEAVRDHQAVGVATGLQPLTSAHGQPKYEGWLGADAGSAWWDTREGRYAMKRDQYVYEQFNEVSEFVHDMEAARGVQALLRAAYDAGAGRTK